MGGEYLWNYYLFSYSSQEPRQNFNNVLRELRHKEVLEAEAKESVQSFEDWRAEQVENGNSFYDWDNDAEEDDEEEDDEEEAEEEHAH